MVKICKLTSKEKGELFINVESFFPMYKKNPKFKAQLACLKSKIKGNCDKEIWTFITAITKAIRYGHNKTYMSFSAEAYRKAAHYTKHPIDHKKMVIVARSLEEKGYIIKYTGFKSKDNSSVSIIKFTDKLLQLFNVESCKNFGSTRTLDYIEMFNTYYTEDEKGKETKHKELIPLKAKKGYGKIKTELSNFNKIIESSAIKVEGVVRTDVLYKRVYEKAFSGAGRYYAYGAFQTLPKEVRKTITINGNKTYSEDFSAIHPSIIRTWLGFKEASNYDPYTIMIDKHCDIKELRKLCKVGLMCLLYSRSKGKAIQALTRKITKDKKSYIDGKYQPRPEEEQKYKSLHSYKGIAREIIEKLIELNSDISEMFFQEDLWYRLQNVDSTIAEYVIRHFTDLGICVLPWHDSFRIEEQHKGELKAIMQEAWLNVLGDLTHCKTTEE